MVRRTSSVANGARMVCAPLAHLARAGALAAALTIGVAGVATAQGPPTPPPGKGAENARKAGIKVSPAAERLMEQAPFGSCFNDPTQAKCPKGITEVVAQKAVQMEDGSLGYAITDEQGNPAPTADASKARASQEAYAAAVPQCFVRASYPYYSGGWAWGAGANECTAAASSQELYVRLDRTTDGIWRTLDYRWSGPYPGNMVVRRTAGYDCGHSNTRHYRTFAQGYSVVNGKWYAGQSPVSGNRDSFFTCP